MQHNPFAHQSGELVCISTGLVGDETVTCDQAEEKGKASMMAMEGKDYSSVKLRRKDKVTSLATISSGITLKNHIAVVNTHQLFNRIVCVVKDTTLLRKCFGYELSPNAPALFDSVSLRKGTKSSLIKAFLCEEITVVPQNPVYVVDGGHLLHSVAWPSPASYGQVMNCYMSYLLHHYGRICVIIFDGYTDNATTKCCEQQRRAARRTSSKIHVQENAMTTATQVEFLANSKNKKSLINQLVTRCQESNIEVHQADSDADVLIVSIALEKSKNGAPTVVVGQDTDLLVLLTAKSNSRPNLWFLRFSSGSKVKDTLFSIEKQKNFLGEEVCELLLFAHAITGCDTTSAVFKKGKRKALQLLQQDSALRENMRVFNDPLSPKEVISAAGEKFMLRLYGCKLTNTLNELRYFRYNHLISKQPLHKSFDIAVLPPTSDSSAQHSFRTFLQVQHWEGNMIEPTEWGWKMKGERLVPICSTLDPAPPELMTVVSCSCAGDCQRNCTCLNYRLNCSAMCENCQGISCKNCPQPNELVSDDDEEEL